MAKNSELVNNNDLKAISELDQSLVKISVTLEKLLVLQGTYTADVTKMAAMSDLLNKALKETESNEKKVNNALSESDRIRRERLKLEEKIIAGRSQEAKALAEVRVQYQQQQRELKNQAKYNTEAEGSLNQLRAALIKLRIEYDAMGKRAQQSPYGKFLAEDIDTLNTTILDAEKSTGRFSRNVGNYASGFNTLGFSVQQVARELPSLSISASQFFLAISNNLPMLADEITRSKNAYKLAISEGKAATPVWKQLLSSIFSWQTAMVVGITLLTVYGKEVGNFISGLFKSNETMKTSLELQKDVNTAMGEGSSGIGDQIVKIKSLQADWSKLGDSLSAKKKFIEENKSAFDGLGISVTSVNDAENVLVDNTDKFIESLKLRAQASAAGELAMKKYQESILKEEEARLKREEAEESRRNQTINRTDVLRDTRFDRSGAPEMAEQRAKGIDNEAKALDNEAKSARDAGDAYFNLKTAREGEADAALVAAGIKKATTKQTKNETKKSVDDERKAIQDLAEYRKQQEVDGYKQTLSDNKKSYTERLGAAEEFENEMASLINIKRDNQLADLRSKFKTQAEYETKAKAQIVLINAKAEAEISKITSEGFKYREDITKDYIQKQIRDYTNGQNEINRSIDRDEQEAFRVASNAYARKEITQEKYEKQRLELTKSYAKSRFDAEIESLKTIVDLYSDSYKDMYGIQMQSQFKGNVDLLSRPMIDSAELVKKGWEDAGDGIATVFSSQYGVESNGKEIEILVTPILPDGTVLSQNELEEYIDNVLNGADDILSADSKGIVIAVDVDQNGQAGQKLHELQEQYYGLADAPKEVADINKQILDKQLEYTKYINELEVKDSEDKGKKILEKEKELAQKRKEILSDLYNSVFDLFSTLSDAEAEKKLQALDKEAESNQEWRDKETKAIEEMEESGAITKEQADARKAVVDQQAEEREKQIEQRRKLIEYEQAKREKAIALTQIAINTAVATSKALPNLLLVALVSALGAVQAATVLAQPLPAYKDGTKDHKGGWALTGDGYRHEMVVTPDGGVFKTPNTPTLMDLPKHSMVFPDFEKAILSASLIMPASGKSDMMVIQENKKQITLSEKNNNLMRQLVYGQDKLLYRSTNSSHASKINTGITNRRY